MPEVLTSGYKWLRAVGQGEFTGVHTDKVFLGRGSPRVLTAWVPLGQVSILSSMLPWSCNTDEEPNFEQGRQALAGTKPVDPVLSCLMYCTVMLNCTGNPHALVSRLFVLVVALQWLDMI